MPKPSNSRFLIEAQRHVGFENIKDMRSFVERAPESSEILNDDGSVQIRTKEYFYKKTKSVYPVFGFINENLPIEYIDVCKTFEEAIARYGSDNDGEKQNLLNVLMEKVGRGLRLYGLKELIENAFGRNISTMQKASGCIDHVNN